MNFLRIDKAGGFKQGRARCFLMRFPVMLFLLLLYFFVVSEKSSTLSEQPLFLSSFVGAMGKKTAHDSISILIKSGALKSLENTDINTYI